MNAPKVEERCTFQVGTDRYPGTVVAVSRSGHRVTVRHDRVVRWSSPEGRAEEIAEDPKGELTTFSRRSDGRYYRVGSRQRVWFGRWNGYQDPTF